MQCEKATHCIFPLTRHSGRDKTTEIVNRTVVASGLGRLEWVAHRVVNCSVRDHNSGSMTLGICQNPEYREQTIMYTNLKIIFRSLGNLRME